MIVKSKVLKTSCGCHIYLAASGNDGYCGASHNGKWIAAHRVSWIEANGEIPDSLCVLHKCDAPSCINPHHLFLGTRDDNNKDRAAKGRSSKVSPTKGYRHREEVRCARSIATEEYFKTHKHPLLGVCLRWITDGANNRRIPDGSELPGGWRLGRAI